MFIVNDRYGMPQDAKWLAIVTSFVGNSTTFDYILFDTLEDAKYWYRLNSGFPNRVGDMVQVVPLIIKKFRPHHKKIL